MSAGQYLYKRFVLPSQKMVEVRRVEEGQRPEGVARGVVAHAQPPAVSAA